MDNPADTQVAPVRLEIRAHPRNPKWLSYFINGQEVKPHQYHELVHDLCYHVAREQTLLAVVQPPIAEELQPRTPGGQQYIQITTDEIQVTLIPSQPEDALNQREIWQRYFFQHQHQGRA